jgi:hypothetical protein
MEMFISSYISHNSVCTDMRCMTCQSLIEEASFTFKNGQTFTVMQDISCQTKNLVYTIIWLGFLPYCSYHFTLQPTFLPYFSYLFTIFFCIFQIFSLFNLLFFHIYHIISLFNLHFPKLWWSTGSPPPQCDEFAERVWPIKISDGARVSKFFNFTVWVRENCESHVSGSDMTGSDVIHAKGNDVTGSDVIFPRFFLTRVVVQKVTSLPVAHLSQIMMVYWFTTTAMWRVCRTSLAYQNIWWCTSIKVF